MPLTDEENIVLNLLRQLKPKNEEVRLIQIRKADFSPRKGGTIEISRFCSKETALGHLLIQDEIPNISAPSQEGIFLFDSEGNSILD